MDIQSKGFATQNRVFFSVVAIGTHPMVTSGNLLHVVLTDQENSYFKYTGYDEGYSKCF